ncbi:RteC domain-containing protein [Chitinophaga arvensicola]|uniref:RteC protein n=1 Tax=Chitinophaga arvensicola TaxID=29529 RepID=A0A1I0PMM8_9BACT|nr:RteC domain-containing protein [Chitinophaga arvensicola]SEW15599.1 RteC protein [Chitinophaga arvensicola]
MTEHWYSQLLAEVRAQNESLELFSVTTSYLAKCLRAVTGIIAELHAHIDRHTFNDEEEEINFFKYVKPEFDGRAYFFTDLLKLEQSAPKKDQQAIEQYYRKRLDSTRSFLLHHQDDQLYLSLGFTYNDQTYFLRYPPTIQNDTLNFLLRDDRASLLPFLDKRYYTPWSYLYAQLVSATFLQEYLEHRLSSATPAGGQPLSPISWTGNKAELVELIYGLNEMGVLNGKKESISSLATFFGNIFQIDLSNIYKMYENNRLKKKSRTPFFDSIKLSLLRRYEYDDEFSK